MPVAKWSLFLWPRHLGLKCCCSLSCTFAQGKMVIVEAPQHTAYNEGCSCLLEWRLWSTGSAFQVQISEQNFDFKCTIWILNSLTDTEVSWSLTRRWEQQLHRKHKASIGIEGKNMLGMWQDFAGYSKGHTWKCQKGERYLFSFLTLLILIMFLVLESESVHQ